MEQENDFIHNAGEAGNPAQSASGPNHTNCCGGNCHKCRHKEAPRGKHYCHNWLNDIPGGFADSDMVEVQFKNTRKGYFHTDPDQKLMMGELVTVEGNPGFDVGEVTLTGTLVAAQMRKAGIRRESDIKRVIRRATAEDIDKWHAVRAKENDTMIRSRQIAAELKLNMKIGDVEYQGDGNKAIFYYIADERVDFRQLIKVLADTFKVRVEMRQIGARQEAGRIGGIGPCGRPLCCSTWMNNFVSVGTAAARFQGLSLNPQKLAGQCAKLKCCINFEVDTYMEASKEMPPKEARLETADSTYYMLKPDIFKREVTYSTDKNVPANLVTITAERAFEVIAMNKRGEKPLSLLPEGMEQPSERKIVDLVEQESLTRFDKTKKKKKKKKGNQQSTSSQAQQKTDRRNDRKAEQRDKEKEFPTKPKDKNQNDSELRQHK